MKAFDQKIEQLLQEKTFHQLTKEEKQYVLNQLPQEEYEALHWTMAKSQSLFRQNKTKPDPAIKARLQAAMQARKPARSPSALLLTLLQFRIPAYQVALGAVCLLFCWWLLQSPVTNPIPEQVIVYQTDTIYKEIPKAVTVAQKTAPSKSKKLKANRTKKSITKREKNQRSPKPVTNLQIEQTQNQTQQPKPKINQAPEKTEVEDFIPANPIIVPQGLVVEKTSGRSLKADADLLVFLEEVR